MDKVITTSFLIIVSVVCSVLVFNAVYPAVIRSSDAMTLQNWASAYTTRGKRVRNPEELIRFGKKA